MRAIFWTLALLLGLPAACADETLTGYGDPQVTYRLTELDGAPFPTRATLRLDSPGMIAGQGPCNSYSAAQEAPYPWFEVGPIRATRRACPDLQHETHFFTALTAMGLAEVQGGVLILSTDTGREMVFRAE